jgi:hypothetical protein
MADTITIDLEQFTKAMQSTTNRSLGWTWLMPTATVGNEMSPPSYSPTLPSVMPAFVLIPNTSYRFTYSSVRYARFCYLLERNGSYEAGELSVIHDLVIVDMTHADEAVPPPEPLPFTPPMITTGQTVSIGSVGSLGVTFSFMHDVSTSGADAKFGLAFKITNATPAFWPRLEAAYITAIEPETV